MRVVNSLREARRDAGLTQEELSRRCGVSRQTIIAVERGVHVPSLTLALQLADVLGHSVSSLFALNRTSSDDEMRSA